MRDPNRIKPFLSEIEKVWNKVPDWRFGQFMVNWLMYLEKDHFYYEDDKMLKELKNFENEVIG